jgi:hypothetical protein
MTGRFSLSVRDKMTVNRVHVKQTGWRVFGRKSQPDRQMVFDKLGYNDRYGLPDIDRV